MISFKTPIDVVLFIAEIIACISFATSGAITALRKKTDLLGVWILTLIEVFGGGLLRDLILNKGAPHIFWDPEYLWLAALVIAISTVCFVLACLPKTAKYLEDHRHAFWIYALDAIGISVFSVAGAKTAFYALPEEIGAFETYVFCVCLGVITGVGGGMFRDVFVGEIPSVFKKHFYMMPCIIGTTIYAAFLINDWGDSYGIVGVALSCAVIITLRILATLFQWNLPRAKAFNTIMEEESKNKN